jgi:hypothetical protein
MKEQNIQINPESKIEKQALSEQLIGKKMDLDAGLLGKIFGGAESAPTNICGFVASLIIVIGLLIFFLPTKIDPMDYWKTIALPLISGILGYIFGKRA